MNLYNALREELGRWWWVITGFFLAVIAVDIGFLIAEWRDVIVGP